MSDTMSGLVGSLVTPFKKDKSIDYDTFEKEINFVIKHGVCSICHPMHVGESLSLTTEERKELARFLVKVVDGRVPTFIHCSFAGTDMSVDMAQHSIGVGATGIVLMVPYNWRPTPEAVIDHFVTVAGNLNGKLFIYNNAEQTNVEITLEMWASLFEKLPNLVGIKDRSLSMPYFTEMCRLKEEMKRKDISIFMGSDHLLTSMPVGGSGCLSACIFVAPNMAFDLYNACKTCHDLQKARSLQFKVTPLLKVLRQNYPATIKYALEVMERPVGETRKPVLPLKPEAKEVVVNTLKSLGILDNEPKGW